MEKQKDCEHKNREYIPAEIDNYVVENLVCLDCPNHTRKGGHMSPAFIDNMMYVGDTAKQGTRVDDA